MKLHDEDIQTLFQTLGKDPTFTSGDFDVRAGWKAVAKQEAFSEEILDGVSYTWRDWVEYGIWDFSHQMLRPVGALAFSFLLFVGSWIGVANASLGSLPGDQLYPVKLGMERLQVALASSSAQKAQLRTEFTSRRLEEMVALAASTNHTNEQLAMAVDRVKQDVTNIQTDLKTESPAQASELAKAVGRKADVYATAVSASAPALPSNVQQKVKEVQTILDETKEQAVDVMITAHEQDVTEENTHELEITFEKAFAHTSTYATEEEQVALSQARELADKGIYRRAFQVLREIDVTHSLTE